MNREKVFKIVLVVVETLWIMMLACACVAFFQVITAHAEEPKVIMHATDISEEALKQQLSEAGFRYDEAQNRFR